MKDYKELIKNINGDAAFRHILSECGADGRVWFDKRFICGYVSRLKHVVEQLVKELGEARNELGEALADARHAEEYAWEAKQERDALAKSLDQTLVRLNDETVRADRLEAENRAKEQYIAETIGKVIKERDAYAKCFRITRTDEPFTNHAVFKVDYKDLICHTEEEIANALVYGFARIINEQRGVQEVEHEAD